MSAPASSSSSSGSWKPDDASWDNLPPCLFLFCFRSYHGFGIITIILDHLARPPMKPVNARPVIAQGLIHVETDALSAFNSFVRTLLE